MFTFPECLVLSLLGFIDSSFIIPLINSQEIYIFFTENITSRVMSSSKMLCETDGIWKSDVVGDRSLIPRFHIGYDLPPRHCIHSKRVNRKQDEHGWLDWSRIREAEAEAVWFSVSLCGACGGYMYPGLCCLLRLMKGEGLPNYPGWPYAFRLLPSVSSFLFRLTVPILHPRVKSISQPTLLLRYISVWVTTFHKYISQDSRLSLRTIHKEPT